MSADNDIPWCAEVLSRKAIRMTSATTPEALAGELQERLEALLVANNCDATPKGWRDLALKLALQYERAFRVIAPVDRDPDAPTGAEPGGCYWEALETRKLATRDKISISAAARVIAKKWGRNARTIENAVTKLNDGRLTPPRWLQRMPWRRTIDDAILAAAKSIESEEASHL